MNVAQICTREVVTATPEESVVDVARRMREHQVGAMIVVESTGQPPQPMGVLTDRDIVISLIAEGSKALDVLPVREAMSKNLVSVHESTDIDEALETMRHHGIRRVAVTDADDALVGILAFDDFVDYFTDRMGRLSGLIDTEIRREAQRDLG